SARAVAGVARGAPSRRVRTVPRGQPERRGHARGLRCDRRGRAGARHEGLPAQGVAPKEQAFAERIRYFISTRQKLVRSRIRGWENRGSGRERGSVSSIPRDVARLERAREGAALSLVRSPWAAVIVAIFREVFSGDVKQVR